MCAVRLLDDNNLLNVMFFFFKQKTAFDMRISDWSSDVCSSDLFPRSRTNPQFNGDTLPASLTEAGIDYVHLPSLGGRRGTAKDRAGSPNTLWREPGFRTYADYALTPALRAGFESLLRLAAERRPAVMCAGIGRAWWRGRGWQV